MAVLEDKQHSKPAAQTTCLIGREDRSRPPAR